MSCLLHFGGAIGSAHIRLSSIDEGSYGFNNAYPHWEEWDFEA